MQYQKQLGLHSKIELELSKILSIVDVRDGLYGDDLCAILVEIKDQKVQTAYNGAKYLLQVWERARGKIYEKTLKNKPIGWEICSQYFYMKLDPKDDDDQYWFYEVHLNEPVKESKLRDYQQNLEFKYFSCSSNWLYYASDKEIYVIQAHQQIALSGMDLQKIKDSAVPYAYYVIQNTWIFHGFLCGKALIEDADNNLFFCDIQFDTRSRPYTIKFQEPLAKVQTDPEKISDKIIDLKTYSRDMNTLFVVTLKQSGTVEFYMNGIKLFSTASKQGGASKIVFKNIGITSDRIYLQSEGEFTYRMKYDGKKRLLFSNAKKVDKIDITNWSRIMHERVKHERIELFFDFKLNGTNLYVSFDKFSATFDLLTKLEFKPVSVQIKEEAQYMLGINKDGDTVGLFQEASDPRQASKSTSKILYISNKGLSSQQNLPGRIVSKAEFQHFRAGGWDQNTYKLQSASYFITEDEKKSRALLTLWPGADLAPQNIGAKVSFGGHERLLNVYSSTKHHQDVFSYFGLLDLKSREAKVFRQTDPQNVEKVTQFKLTNLIDDHLKNIHTVVFPKYSKDSVFLFSQTGIFVYDVNTHKVEQKYTSFNLQPYNIQIINSTYLYFQNLEGLCILNLKSLLSPHGAQEILLQKTYNSTNQIQYDPYFDRILYFSDFTTVDIIPMPHKNIVIPFGFNKLTGKFGQESIDTCFVSRAVDHEIPGYTSTQIFKRLVAVTSSKKVIAWEYPTGQYIERIDSQLQALLAEQDKFYEYTSIHTREVGKRYSLYCAPCLEEESKSANQSSQQTRGQLHMFKMLKFKNSGEPFIHKQFKLHIIPGDYIHFDTEINTILHVQVDAGLCRQASVYNLNKTPNEIMARPSLASVIQRFPWDIYSKCPESNFLFSPNLTSYLSYDTKLQSFVVSRVDKGEKVKYGKTILEGLFNQEDQDFDPLHIVNNFKWEYENIFRVVNRDGFEKMVKVTERDWKLLDSTYVPMKDILNTNSQSQYYYENYKNKVKSTFERLLRRYQKSFTNRQLSVRSKRGTKDNEYVLQRKFKRFFIMFNYSQYHFKMTQALIKVNQETIAEKIDNEDLKSLLMAVYHGNNLFLHKVFAKQYRKDIGLDEDKLKNFSGVTLQKLLGKLYDKDQENQRFFFPFISNDKGLTPFDLCLPTNLKSADVMLHYLKYQPPGSHSEYTIISLPKLIEHDLPSLPAYMDSRIVQTRAHKRITTMQDFEPIENKDYMLESSHLSPDFSSFFKKFTPKRFKTLCGRKIPLEKSVILKEKEVKVEVLDLPFLHSYNGEGFSHASGLFRELANADNMTIFNSKAVQYLIDFNWERTKMYTIVYLFIPFVLFQGAFIAYSNVYNGQFDNPDQSFEIGYIILSALLYLFSLYFLLNEIGQLCLTKENYFGSGMIWNLIDFLPPCFIIAVVTQRLRQDYEWDELMKPGFIDTVHAVTCLLMWLKFLYFLRLFESTQHLVRVIFSTFWHMRYFIGIFCIFCMAFGEAFLRLAEKTDTPDGENSFLDNFAEAFVYCVRLGVGDTDVQGLYDLNQPITGWILFVVFEFITTVLLLSLLVTLILKHYDQISKDAELASYQQKAKLIFENAYLTQLCRCCNCTNLEMERNLMIITDMTDQGMKIKNTAGMDPLAVVLEEVVSVKDENRRIREEMEKERIENGRKIEAIYQQIINKKA